MAKPAIQTFGKYQILERIATGGMAEIYKARLEGIGGFQRTFAIKRILPNLSQNSDYIAMLVDEAKVAGLLSHANIVQILDLGQVDSVWYIAMEFVDGRDLGAVLRRANEKGLRLPVPHAVFIAIELLKGLEYAHQRQVMRGGRPVPLNIIHRDVSPPNVLLSFQGEVKLTDFGIARASLKAMETVSGIVKGRFDYMSSEQAAGGRDLDQRSDLFSVGVVLYEMLTGTHPFRADNEIATVERVRMGKYTPVSQRNPEVPFTLETIVDRALRADRNERYPTATAFKEALDKFFHESGFIFTHATLASYVKGLFPEAAPRSKSRPAEPRRSRRRTSSGDYEPDDGPTKVIDQSVVQRELQRQRQSKSTPVGGFGLRQADNEATAIQQNPLVGANRGAFGNSTATGFDVDPPTAAIGRRAEWEDEAETVIRSAKSVHDQWEDQEQETVIRSSPFEDGDPNDTWVAGGSNDDLALDEPDDVELQSQTGSITGLVASDLEEIARASQVPQPPREAARAGTPGPAPPKTRVVVRRTRIGWLGIVLAIITLCIGLIGGALVVGPVVWLMTGSSATANLSDPQLHVIAPPRTAVKLNGDAVSNVVSVQPNTPHRLEVTVPGYRPWTHELTMEPGEVRMVIVPVREMKKSKGKSGPR